MKRSHVSVLITALLTSGCASLDPAVGLFVLQTVEGSPLPYTVEQDVGAFADITVGHVRVSEGGTCEASITLVDNSNALSVGTTIGPCTWSRQGSVITFVYDRIFSDGVAVGTLAGDRLAVTLEGLAMVLERS